MLEELKSKIENDLKNQAISPKILLDNLSILNEQSRKSSSYVDPNYIPFYYHLGKYLNVKKMIEIETGAALHSCSFLKSCKTIETFLAFQSKKDDFFSSRFAYKNIKKNYKGDFDLYYGNIKDNNFEVKVNKHNWDLVLFNEEEMSYDSLLFTFSKLWLNLESDGLFVVNFVNSIDSVKKCFNNFCKIQNIKNVILNTRYGTGIIKK